LLRFGDLIGAGVLCQGVSQFAPMRSIKAEAQEEVSFAAAGWVRRVKKIGHYLSLGHDCPLCVRQLHAVREPIAWLLRPFRAGLAAAASGAVSFS
jgi:hypothetical protein